MSENPTSNGTLLGIVASHLKRKNDFLEQEAMTLAIMLERAMAENAQTKLPAKQEGGE